MIAVFWNFVVTFAFYNRHFIVLLDSAIRMSGLILWFKITNVWLPEIAWSDRRFPILEASNLYKAKLNRRTRPKCSVFRNLKQQLTCWYVENEFGVQKHRYETDDSMNDLQLKVFDRESKPSGFIWFSWIHIIFFSTAVGRVDFQRWLTDSVYVRRELKAKGKKNAFNKPS